MKEITELKVFQVTYKCDECKEGNMEPFGNRVFASYPAQHPHKCTKCGHEINVSGETYPKIIYEPVNKGLDFKRCDVCEKGHYFNSGTDLSKMESIYHCDSCGHSRNFNIKDNI